MAAAHPGDGRNPCRVVPRCQDEAAIVRRNGMVTLAPRQRTGAWGNNEIHVHPPLVIVQFLVGIVLTGCAPTHPPLRDPAEAVARARSAADPVSKLEIWMLDVGQVSCIYIACPDESSSILVDCGTSSIGATTGDAVSAWLDKTMAQASAVTVLVTHGQTDHISP